MTRALFESVHADPWTSELVDLASLNAHASQAVEDAVEHVRRAARREARSVRSSSLVVLGPPGAGKTHLFARLRKKLGPRAVFVLVRPLVHAEMTPRFVLGEIVRQLGFAPPRGLPQTNALVGSFLGRLDGVGATYPSTVLNEYAALPEEERSERLELAIEGMLALCPELDEVYLSRLLGVPFASPATARALLAWLSAMDCDAAQLRRIGAASSLGDGRALPALRTLAATCALGAPIVLVFDQLENLLDGPSGGPRLRAYAHLASELVDVLRGVVFVHLALDSEWAEGIEPTFNASQHSRIVMRREVLRLPDAGERGALLRLFHRQLLTAPAPLPWPLGAARLASLCDEPGVTPRRLLSEFKGALEERNAEDPAAQAPPARPEPAPPASAPPSPQPAPRRDIASDWLARLRSSRESVRAAAEERMPLHAARLADGLLSLGRFVAGLSIKPSAKPPAQLQLERAGRVERVAILQEANHRSLAGVVARLLRAAEQGPLLVLRERARGMPDSWTEARSRRAALLATGRARWIEIEPEDCARLLALASFLQAARSGDVTDSRGQPVSFAEVSDWIDSTLDITRWPLVRDLAGQEASAEPRAPLPPPLHAPNAEEHAAPESFIQELGGTGRRVSAGGHPLDPGPLPRERPATAAARAASTAAAVARSTTVLPALQRLRVASFERLVREVLRVDPDATRASVLAELDAAGDHVRWLGRSIVFLRENE